MNFLFRDRPQFFWNQTLVKTKHVKKASTNRLLNRMSFTRWENWEKNVTRCDKNFRNSYFALSNNIYSRRRETFFHFFLTYDLHWIKILHRKQSMCNLATKWRKKQFHGESVLARNPSYSHYALSVVIRQTAGNHKNHYLPKRWMTKIG